MLLNPFGRRCNRAEEIAKWRAEHPAEAAEYYRVAKLREDEWRLSLPLEEKLCKPCGRCGFREPATHMNRLLDQPLTIHCRPGSDETCREEQVMLTKENFKLEPMKMPPIGIFYLDYKFGKDEP